MAYQNRNNHFEEIFQESEYNVSENGELTGKDNGSFNENGQAIQLVKVRPGGKIQLNQKALDIIASCDQPVGFVSLVGKYRTGKSFLLNKLLSLQNQGFRVDASTSACTQGIWMWSKPIYNSKLKNYVFFLDTQGTDSLTKDPHHDSKIFIIACLISSFFIYNTVGSIDEKAIGELNMVTSLANNILIQDKLSPKDNEQYLHRFMPKFLWVLRDFTLELKDQNGIKITPNQYLQSVLVDQNSLIRNNENIRKVRRSLMTYFKDRQCMVLVRPAKEQSDLQKLHSLPNYALRSEFLDGIRLLKQKIMKNAGPKMHEGDPLYGSSIASMIQCYVDSINRGGIPNIKTAWEHIADNQGNCAYNCAIQKYTKMVESCFPDDTPIDDSELPQILARIREQTMEEFNSNLTQPSQAYYGKLKEFLLEKQKRITQINTELNLNKNQEILMECVQKFALNLQNKVYVGKQDDFNRDLKKVQKDYNSRAKGANKGQILAQFLNKAYPAFYNLEKSSSIPPKQNQDAKDIYERELRILKEKNNSLENQLKLTTQNPLLIKDTKSKTTEKPSAREKSGGCCGPEGKCIIM